MRFLLLFLLIAAGCAQSEEHDETPPARKTASHLPETEAPAEMQISDEAKLPVGSAETEIYHSPEYIVGTYTRYPLRAELRQAIIERHNLKQVAADSSDVEFFLRQYPPHWPEISVSDSTWYAWPYNRGAGDRNLQINYILVIDETSSTMCLLAQNHDVTP